MYTSSEINMAICFFKISICLCLSFNSLCFWIDVFILSYVLLNILKDSLRVLVNSLIIHISNFISHIFIFHEEWVFLWEGENGCYWNVGKWSFTVRFPCTTLNFLTLVSFPSVYFAFIYPANFPQTLLWSFIFPLKISPLSSG